VTSDARFITLVLTAGLTVARISDATAFNDPTVTAESGGIAAGGDIRNNTINQTIIQQNPAILAMMAKTFADEMAATAEARAHAEARAADLAAKLGFTTESVTGFLQTLGEQNVPLEKIPAKLNEIATQAVATRQRLALLDPDDPAIMRLVDQAKAELDKGHSNKASAFLQQAEEADLAAAQQLSAALNARQLHAARMRESLGDVALTQLHYDEAARDFAAAVKELPASSSEDKGRLLYRQANALYRQGDERDDNAALADSISVWKQTLQEYPQEQVPVVWAMTQMNLGNALRALGECEEAVKAYHLALEEMPRERAPLDWAMTQMNLGNALLALGKPEEAVQAYRLALEVRTRRQVPLQWAMTQHNLGNALLALGQREEAVTAYRLALEVRTRERVPLDWAATQFSLGRALYALWSAGERESGMACLEEAVAADRSALQEMPRERMPQKWAMTQIDLGVALKALGQRESGTAHLDEAAEALSACMQITGCPPDLARYAQTQRDTVQAEIGRREAE
jgi:tetratricopeptide (TPR) repeat protein